MTIRKRKKRSTPSMFHVGDHVAFSLGNRKVRGIIVEDRGAIAAGGRRLFQVKVPLDPGEPTLFEMPLDEIEAERTTS